MTIIKPLDWETVLIEYLAGSETIFFFLAIILFAILGASYRMPNLIFLMLMALFMVLMAGLGMNYGIVILIVAIAAAFLIRNFLKKFKQEDACGCGCSSCPTDPVACEEKPEKEK